MSEKTSYGQILKSSSIMGGAAGITMLLGMVRTKFAAVLIGSTGVGLMAGFTAIQGIVGTVAGLGIQSSAVREIAAAVGEGDEDAIGNSVQTLRRICWLTGLVGMLLMAAFSPLLSKLTFDTDAYTLDIAALGVVILLANLAGGQLALLQGMRHIGDMARANIGGAVLATLTAIGFFYWLGLRGIVPALVCIAAIQLAIAWYFARRVAVAPVQLSWRQTFRAASEMVKLGLVFMWSALMVSGVNYITITLINREMGLDAVGLYSAAFLLSGMLVNFVLSAMGADYYPRLVSVAHDKIAMNRLVNEQTEIGLLLALPGLIATLSLAPWILQIFYTQEFLGAVNLLQWFVLGCLGRVISWPLGFVMLALGKGTRFLLIDTGANLVHLALVVVGMKWLGLEGVAIAFFLLYVGLIFAVYLACRYLTGLRWTTDCWRIARYSLLAILITFIICRYLSVWPSTLIGMITALTSGIFSLRVLARLVGPEHRLVRMISSLPGVKKFLTSQ